MKKLMILLLVGIYTMLAAQTPEEDIRRVLNTQSDAWNKADIDGFMKYYWNNPELTFVSKKGVSKGWQQVYDNYKKGYPSQEAMGVLTFDNLVFEKMNPKAYVVTGSWHLQRKEEVGGWFTLIFKKFKKDWLIVYDHTS
jgi:ketosteroid isomerase-like protein